MHVDVSPGTVTVSASREQLVVTWQTTLGTATAEFRVEGDKARLSNIGVPQPNKDAQLEVGEPSLEDIPRQYRLIIKGAGLELKEPGEVL